MNFYGGFLVFLLVGGALFLTIYLPIAAVNTDIPKTLSLAFPSLGAEYAYEEVVCPCKNDWPLATNERNISNDVFSQTAPIYDPRGLSNLVWGWGQFVDHDMMRTDTNTSDTVYPLFGLNLTRAQYQLDGAGCRAPRTFISAMIDGTTVYGDYLTGDLGLRDGLKCELRTSAGNLLPVANDSSTFIAGDIRNTEHSLLNSLHTVWMREHNRLCGVLGRLRRDWTEDEKFWKARQVVVAKIQHITYEEWLPALFGAQIGLLDSVTERGTGLRIASEFGNSIYRFGHSMVPDTLGQFTLLQMFFNVNLMQAYGVEPFLHAAMYERAQQVDNKVGDGLRNLLFGKEDLVTRNIFRGRDVGLATYEGVAACYGTYAYPSTYEDSYVGALSEPLATGSSLPYTIAVVVAEQFKRQRKHDAFFYTKQRYAIGDYFWDEIQKTTIVDVIRRNTALTNLKDKGFFV